MRPKPVFSKKDEDKTREELVDELEALRSHYSRLKAIVQRYERVTRKKDIFNSLYDLEAERDRIEELQAELRKKDKETDQQSEELEVQKEEIKSNIEELRSREEVVRAREAQLKAEEEEEEEEEARRKIAIAVEAERKRLFDVLENLPAMICLLTADYHVAFANRAFREKFGESGGKHCFEYCFVRTEPCEFCEAYNVLKNGKPHSWKVACPDGSVMDVYDVPYADADGNLMVLEMCIDVTERVRAEGALRASKENLARAQEIAHLGNWSWDIRSNEEEWSDESFRIFGFEPGEVQPDYELYLGLLHPEDRGRLLALMKDMFEKNMPFNVDYRIIRRDGSVRYIHSEGQISHDSEGRPLRVFGINQDITERKRAEEEIKAAKQQAELYLDLMGHDINNMHQIAMGYLEMASKTPCGEEQTSFINKSVEVLERSAQLISNVRKLQKLRDGIFHDHDLDVIPILWDLQQAYGLIPNKHIILNVNCEHCYVRANELLRDVYANLITNAIKHTGDKSDITVDVGVIKDNGSQYCRVIVEDNGPGIPDAKKATVFNRTLNGSNKAKGMGLGLYIVKTLVDSYGGQVWVEDRVKGDHSKGSRFIVYLPVVEDSHGE